jgi:coproporphyrinogen III oxidase-like Fe-S oxidoreductase
MAHEEVSRNVTEGGFATWNMDLIVGSRAESLEDVAHTLEDLLGLESPPPHISCYVLTPEPGTPLGEDPGRHPDEDDTADAYELVSGTLEAHGYRVGGDLELGQARARVSPQPRLLGPRRLRRLRIGRALSSHGRRFWNVRTPDRYIAMVRDGTRPLGGEESLDARTQTFERDSLALRTAKGVPLEAFDSLDEIAHLVSVADGRVTLAPNGRLLANQVILRLGSAE